MLYINKFWQILRDLFTGLFLRKATRNHVVQILKDNHFVFTNSDIKKLLEGNTKGIRYGNSVLVRSESDGDRKRFLKLMLNGKLRTYKLFRRQIEISRELNADDSFQAPVMSVVRAHLKPPVPYAILETHESGKGYGFMDGTAEYYGRIDAKDARSIVNALYSFHNAGKYISTKVLQHTRNISSDVSSYEKELKKYFDKVIEHKTKDGEIMQKTVEELLIIHTNISEYRNFLGVN